MGAGNRRSADNDRNRRHELGPIAVLAGHDIHRPGRAQLRHDHTLGGEVDAGTAGDDDIDAVGKCREACACILVDGCGNRNGDLLEGLWHGPGEVAGEHKMAVAARDVTELQFDVPALADKRRLARVNAQGHHPCRSRCEQCSRPAPRTVGQTDLEGSGESAAGAIDDEQLEVVGKRRESAAGAV